MNYTSHRFSVSFLIACVSALVAAVLLSQAFVAQAQSAAPTCTLTAIPTEIAIGNYSTLTWSSTNAGSLSFDQGIGSVSSVGSGSLSVEPTTTPITYTATFSGAGGTTTCLATITAPGSGAGSVVPIATTTTPTTPTPTTPPTVTTTGPMPTVETIDENGNALIRGTVTSVSADSLSLSSWGGVWTIPLQTGTEVTPLGTTGAADFSNIGYGDFVGVAGIVSTGQSWTIIPTTVRDWTKNPPTETGVPTTTPTSPPVTSTSTSMTEGGTGTSTSALPVGDTLYTGSISNITSNSFTLTDASGTAYTVAVAPGATIWDNAGNTIPLSTFADGDAIRLDGQMQSDGSILADVVRDTAQ